MTELEAAIRAYGEACFRSARASEMDEKLEAAIEVARAIADHRDSAELQAVKRIGAQMSNILFNIAQRPGIALTPARCASFDACRKEWDEAIRALKSQQDAIASPRSAHHADHNSTLEASAAICKRLASEALDNPNVHKDSRTVVHAALLAAAMEIVGLKARRSGN